MGGKGDNNEVDWDSGKGYSADEMPKEAPIPMEYNPLWQSDTNPLLPYTAGGPLLVLRNPAPGSTTDFEKYRVKQMKSLVDAGTPQELEDVGEALWNAARSIKSAERELKTYFEETDPDWEGEAKRGFDAWATKLQSNTIKLSEYAGMIGSHLKGAGIGLAMVQTSMPEPSPEDEDGPSTKGGDDADSKGGDDKGPKKDPNHQEAVRQMERLSSYYRVALQHIQAAEKDKPVFEALPDVGLPPAPPGYQAPGHSAGGGHESASSVPAAGGIGVPDGPGSQTAAYVPGGNGAINRPDTIAPPHLPDDPVRPGVSVGTNIDSAPPAPVVQPMDRAPSPHVPQVPGQPPGLPPTGGPPAPGPVYVPPGSPPPPGRVGPSAPGPQRPYVPPPTNTGRNGPTGPAPVGRPGPMRPGPVGPVMPGPTGREAGNSGPRALGRPGMMGVPPTTPPTNAGGRGANPGAARAVQRGGIVGGTPSQPGAGTNSPSSPRSRGMVIDGQGVATPRRPTGMVPPVSALGAGGVGGAPDGRRATDRRRAAGRNGIVGEPRNGEPEQELEGRDSVPGGTGLVVGGQNPPSRQQQREASGRPDYLSEDEQNNPTRRRGSVPPVIE
ncbi:WXG100 family type VII secretion target [Streptomyces smyrnaeus]|uniref:WXG100 family type VII secretion target n=1 Tax=Streptomyces smyrnaeus TaxID=1387713 RepID=UPI003407FC17